MPVIEKYTRENTQQMAASPQAFGSDQSGVMQLGKAFEQSGGILQEAVIKQNNRLDTIARARELAQFNQEALQEYTKFEQERDLTDPKSAQEYNQLVRTKASEYLAKHAGTADSRVAFETQLLGLQDKYTTQMANTAIGAQKTFIRTTVGNHISELSAEAYNNPQDIGKVFQKLDTVMKEYGPALDTEDELALIDAAQEDIARKVLDSFVDSGRYKDAKNVINENPAFMSAMRPEVQRQYLQTIQGGLDKENAEVEKTRRQLTAARAVAQELGVEVSGTQLFTAVTGIENAQTPQAKIDEFAKAANLKQEQITPSMVAKIGFGVDLPAASEVDYNKEYTPTGALTPKGIGGKIDAPFKAAAAARVYKDKVDGAIDLYKNEGNSQALLSAMITFQKALDDGAVVREGDIALQRSADSLKNRLQLVISNAESGQPISEAMVGQMQQTMDDFVMQTLESNKTYIDPYLQDARKNGYRLIDIGMPQQAYDKVFAGVKTKEDAKTGALDKITAIAKQNGMTVDEAIQSTATASGKTVEQVRKDLGLANN